MKEVVWVTGKDELERSRFAKKLLGGGSYYLDKSEQTSEEEVLQIAGWAKNLLSRGRRVIISIDMPHSLRKKIEAIVDSYFIFITHGSEIGKSPEGMWDAECLVDRKEDVKDKDWGSSLLA